jgi:hypothetical protein
MSDTSIIPGEKPVNDGGGNAPQAQPEPIEEQVAAAETEASQEDSSD